MGDDLPLSRNGSSGFQIVTDVKKSGLPNSSWIENITLEICIHKNGDGSIDAQARSFMKKGYAYDAEKVKKSTINGFTKIQADEFWKVLKMVASPETVANELQQNINTLSAPAPRCRLNELSISPSAGY
jgi:hypothetical protein